MTFSPLAASAPMRRLPRPCAAGETATATAGCDEEGSANINGPKVVKLMNEHPVKHINTMGRAHSLEAGLAALRSESWYRRPELQVGRLQRMPRVQNGKAYP